MLKVESLRLKVLFFKMNPGMEIIYLLNSLATFKEQTEAPQTLPHLEGLASVLL
jgi:hypothetical protein